MDTSPSREPHLGTKSHETNASEEEHRAVGEGDDEGEEEAAEQEEMANVDRASEHDDSKRSDQDADEGETKQAGADEVKHAHSAGKKRSCYATGDGGC